MTREEREVFSEMLDALRYARTCMAYCRKYHADAQKGTGVPAENFLGEVIARAEKGFNPGFKQVVLLALRAHPEGLTPKEVKSWISREDKMDLSRYTNASSSIHTTLRRLSKNKAEIIVNEKGKKAFRLKGGMAA